MKTRFPSVAIPVGTTMLVDDGSQWSPPVQAEAASAPIAMRKILMLRA
jgi:hypothetical protein